MNPTNKINNNIRCVRRNYFNLLLEGKDRKLVMNTRRSTLNQINMIFILRNINRNIFK